MKKCFFGLAAMVCVASLQAASSGDYIDDKVSSKEYPVFAGNNVSGNINITKPDPGAEINIDKFATLEHIHFSNISDLGQDYNSNYLRIFGDLDTLDPMIQCASSRKQIDNLNSYTIHWSPSKGFYGGSSTIYYGGVPDNERFLVHQFAMYGSNGWLVFKTASGSCANQYAKVRIDKEYNIEMYTTDESDDSCGRFTYDAAKNTLYYEGQGPTFSNFRTGAPNTDNRYHGKWYLGGGYHLEQVEYRQ